MRTLGLALLLLLAGCGAQTGEVADEPTTPPTELTITVSGEGAPYTWTLTCDPPGGTHTDAAGACGALDAMTDPFAPVPKDMMCTQVYGGSETATVVGTWRGQRVDASFKRTDGCEIARWAKHAAVLGWSATSSSQ